MAYATDSRGHVIHRTAEMEMPVQLVKVGDLLFNIPVVVSEPESDWIWVIEAHPADESKGIRLLMTINEPVTVKRSMPLEENQCIDCGRHGIKYAARHQCSACYQRKHRDAARKQQAQPEQLRLIG